MKFLRNCWYVAAWSDELSQDKMVARTFLDEPVVLFRDGQGRARALLDRCPHRFAPLSMGTIENDSIRCGYHGLAFDGSGACVSNPHGPVLKSMCVKSYPVREEHRAVWIWMGDPDRIDDELPPLGFVDETPPTAFSSGYVLGQANYQYYVDNIMDLTHVDYLHANTLGGGALSRTKPAISQSQDSIYMAYVCKNEKAPPAMARNLEEGADNADFYMDVAWFKPSTLTLRSTVVPAGRERSSGPTTHNIHIMTPETEYSTHYFFASTRDYAVEDAAYNAEFAALRAEIFSTEDKPMIDAQQKRIGKQDFWSLNPILLRTDEGAVRVRRLLEALIEGEQSAR